MIKVLITNALHAYISLLPLSKPNIPWKSFDKQATAALLRRTRQVTY